MFRIMSDSHSMSVPWKMVAPFEDAAKRNHGGQSLKTLHSRGGLSPREFRSVMTGVNWRKLPPDSECFEWIKGQVAKFNDRPLREALAGVMSLVESGYFVRDISRDGEPDWAMRQLEGVTKLKAAHQALSGSEGEKES